jgi:hypothetical protein
VLCIDHSLLTEDLCRKAQVRFRERTDRTEKLLLNPTREAGYRTLHGLKLFIETLGNVVQTFLLEVVRD